MNADAVPVTCPRCRAEVPPGSAFCNRCGATLGGTVAPPPPPAPVVPEPEREVWRGRMSGRAQIHLWFLWVLWLGALGYVWWGVFSPAMRERMEAIVVSAAAAVLPALWILGSWAVDTLGTRYRLTTHRLFRDKGILFRTYEEVDLVRVDDVSVRQSLWGRILNIGIVSVISPTDATTPRLELVAIHDPMEVKERVRACANRRRETRGTLRVESI